MLTHVVDCARCGRPFGCVCGLPLLGARAGALVSSAVAGPLPVLVDLHRTGGQAHRGFPFLGVPDDGGRAVLLFFALTRMALDPVEVASIAVAGVGHPWQLPYEGRTALQLRLPNAYGWTVHSTATRPARLRSTGRRLARDLGATARLVHPDGTVEPVTPARPAH